MGVYMWVDVMTIFRCHGYMIIPPHHEIFEGFQHILNKIEEYVRILLIDVLYFNVFTHPVLPMYIDHSWLIGGSIIYKYVCVCSFSIIGLICACFLICSFELSPKTLLLL